SQDQTLQKLYRVQSTQKKNHKGLIKRPALANTLFSFQGVLSESACIGYNFNSFLSTPFFKKI
ncbi:MAG: hypothetical protein IJT06_06925, partial [Selenomonadaceae bacterium]|nr:hypothetical protein [Selenomonadaceae bacterium]